MTRPATEDQDASSSTEAFLDGLLGEMLANLGAGRTMDIEARCALQPERQAQIRDVWELARDVAIDKPRPSISIPGYIVERELGHGAMGVVYLARQTVLGRSVALKVLPTAAALSAHGRTRFLVEARALAAVRHEHVVAIHDVIDNDGVLAYAMEWIDGRTLKELTAPARADGEAPLAPLPEFGGSTPLQFVVRTGISVARALHAVHEAGLVHRDVKPSNILVRRDGRAFLADFGLVRDETSSLTMTGGFLGTVAYAAPEQLRGSDVGARADVYSLAVSLFEACCGALPYPGRTPGEVSAAIEGGLGRPLRRLLPTAPRDLETILAHAMEVDPSARYATAAEFADDLERLLRIEPIHAQRVRAGKRLLRWAQRRRALVAAIVATTVAVTLLAVFIAGRVIEHRAEVASRPERARAEIARARQELLVWADYEPIDARRLAKRREHFDRAIRAYETATQLAPERQEAASELNVVRALAAIDDGRSFKTAVGCLHPQTAAALEAAVTRDEFAATASPLIAADRWTLGFVALLTNSPKLTLAAWGDQETDLLGEPLVDAAIGIVLHRDGRRARACSYLRRAHQQYPGVATLGLRFADAAIALGDRELAHKALRAVAVGVAVEPDLRAWHVLLEGDLLYGEGRVNEAVQAYERANGLVPAGAEWGLLLAPGSEHPVWVRRAVAALDAGNVAKANECIAHLDPKRAAHRRLRARLAIQTGDWRGYLEQVAWVSAQKLGRGQPSHAIRDMLEILRLGGLWEFCQYGLRVTGLEPDGPNDPLFAPALTFPRPFSSPQTEALLVRLSWCSVGTAEAIAAALLTGLGFVYQLPENVVMSEFAMRGLVQGLRRVGEWSRVAPLLSVALAAVGGSGVRAQQAIHTWEGAEPYAAMEQMANVGDIDGDGFVDILVGASGGSGGTWTGGAYLFSGRTGEQLKIFRSEPFLHLGRYVASAGDLNHDGIPDLLIGSGLSHSGGNRGRVEAWSHSRASQDWRMLWRVDGSGDDCAWFAESLGDITGDRVPDILIGGYGRNASHGRIDLVDGADPRNVIRSWTGTQSRSAFGSLFCPVPDQDGDGKPDVLVGAHTFDGPNGVDAGRVWLFSGGRDNTILRVWDGANRGDNLGSPVNLGPDLDGDEVQDFLVGASMYANRGAGMAIAISARTGTEIRRWTGQQAGERFANIARAGDVNGDGIEDLAIAAPYATVNGNSRAGYVAVYSGRNLSRLLVRIEGQVPDAGLGGSDVSGKSLSATDLNRDGYGDFLVADEGANRSGRVRVIAGAPFGATIIGPPSTCCVGRPPQVLSVNAPPTPGDASFAVHGFGLPTSGVAIPLLAMGPGDLTLGCLRLRLDPTTLIDVPAVRPDNTGSITVPLPLPASFVPGEICVQVLVYDPANLCAEPAGFSLTNALRL